MFARHLATRCQQPGETSDIYFQALHALTEDCNFTNVTAAEFKNQSICVVFTTGIHLSTNQQRLLEHSTLTLVDMVKQVGTLDSPPVSPVQVNALVEEISPEAVQLNAISSLSRN